MQCELCGKDPAQARVVIEGSEHNVCSSCASFGKIIKQIPPLAATPKDSKNRQQTTTMRAAPATKEMVQIIVPNYPQLIKGTRERMDLTQKDFAKLIAERESLLHQIETGRTEPSIALARKLEKQFHLVLVEQQEIEHPAASSRPKSNEVTLGDFVEIKRRKKTG